jgi:glycosyltransferase involved in cell wall biosynthesis
LVHDWLTGMRGGEKCLEVACELLPDAPLFTLLHNPGSVSPAIESRKILASPLQQIPGVFERYRYLLPLFPWALSQLRTDHYGAVLSFSHCVVKSALTAPGGRHVCYCFTPMRYVWGLEDQYFGSRLTPRRAALDAVLGLIRSWDRRTAGRVTDFVAISEHIRRRVRRAYGRDSSVLYPPVDAAFYCPPAHREPPGDFYLIVSALAPYKRIDLAIEAFNRLRLPLKIIGAGQDEVELRRLAGPTVEFLGKQPDAVLRDHYRRCRAFVFPGEEDFGITPLEAQACGRPVIALGVGGALETVVPPEADPVAATGLFFAGPTVESLMAAVRRFEASAAQFSPDACRGNALRFDRPVFKRKLSELIDRSFFGG